MGRGLSKLNTLGAGKKSGNVISRIMGSLWDVSTVTAQISMTTVVRSDDGRPKNAEEFAKMKSEWERARKILHWCESRTRKLVILGAVLVVVSLIIRLILKIAKLAARFSPPAAADFATTYYKAQDILKRVGTITAVITTAVAIINRMCAYRLEQLLALQAELGLDDVTDFGDTDPDDFFNFDVDEFARELAKIQFELTELDKQRSPQSQSECDLVFSKLDAIDTLDMIVSDIGQIASDPFIMAQYRGGESSLVDLRDRIVDIRRRLTPSRDAKNDGSDEWDDDTGYGSGWVFVEDPKKNADTKRGGI